MNTSQPTTPTLDRNNVVTATTSTKRPFVEPTVAEAGDLLEVTRNFMFMMLMSGGGFDSGGGDGDTEFV